jgi:hypothetical protein
VEQRRARANAGCRDQAVERPADSHTGPASGSVELGCEGEVIEAVEPKDGERPQVPFDRSGFPLRAQALQDLGEDDVGQSNRLAGLNGSLN